MDKCTVKQIIVDVWIKRYIIDKWIARQTDRQTVLSSRIVLTFYWSESWQTALLHFSLGSFCSVFGVDMHLLHWAKVKAKLDTISFHWHYEDMTYEQCTLSLPQALERGKIFHSKYLLKMMKKNLHLLDWIVFLNLPIQSLLRKIFVTKSQKSPHSGWWEEPAVPGSTFQRWFIAHFLLRSAYLV